MSPNAQAYLELAQQYLGLIPAFPGTERGDQADKLHRRMCEVYDMMSALEREEADSLLGRFYET